MTKSKAAREKFEREYEKFDQKFRNAKTERQKATISGNFVCKGTKGKNRENCLARARYHYHHEFE